MKIMITCCIYVLDNETSENIRKNDLKRIKILVDEKEQLLCIPFEKKGNIKDVIRNRLSNFFKKEIYHLEQVYTLAEEKYSYKNEINIIYVAITNKENLKDKINNYKLIEFGVLNNETIVFGKEEFNYKTDQKIINGSIEYIHNVEAKNLILEKDLLQLLIAYKHIRSRAMKTDIIFKFMPSTFTLEDVRLVYEKITNDIVDKSNFRKKIIKYCETTDEVIDNKGFRPTQVYKYKSNLEDIWI